MIRSWTALLGLGALAAAACSAPAEPPPSVATAPIASSDAGAAPTTAPTAEPTPSADGAVPARVADLHRTMFERSAKPVPGGGVQCLITVHDGEPSHDRFHAVVLFADGAVATWTQAPTGRVEPFLAQLAPDEGARARAWLEEVARSRDAARDRFPPSTTVVGISAPVGDRVGTSYFASGETPEPLDRLVQLLKHRLEATNAP